MYSPTIPCRRSSAARTSSSSWRSARASLCDERESRHRCERYHNAERRADSLSALEADRPSVALDDPSRYNKAKTGARDCREPRIRGAEETVEHLILLGLGDSDAGVGDFDLSVLANPSRRQGDGAAFRRVLQRVRDQVVEDLAQTRGIPTHRKVRVGDDLEHDASALGEWPGVFPDLLDQIV